MYNRGSFNWAAFGVCVAILFTAVGIPVGLIVAFDTPEARARDAKARTERLRDCADRCKAAGAARYHLDPRYCCVCDFDVK